IDFVKPNMSLAVVPKAKGDEEKIAQGLTKLMEEDKTFLLENNKETRQQVLKGLGDQHIDVIISKLKNKFGVEISFEKPRVPYREAIRKKIFSSKLPKSATACSKRSMFIICSMKILTTDKQIYTNISIPQISGEIKENITLYMEKN
ncbi:MAG: hypothetical protein IIX27_02485, partial [Ruminococcus sp.]|nr:hypothetical protein [Ruminococcus sp.]